MFKLIRSTHLNLPELQVPRLLTGLVLIIGMLGLQGCSLFNQKAKESRPPAVLKEITPTLKVQNLWKTSVGDHAEGMGLALQPMVKDGVVYVAGHNGVVRALKAKTGKAVWSKATGVSLSAGPGVGPGRVVVAGNDGDVIALDITNGNELWRSKVSGEVLSTPTVSIEQVAIRSANGTLNLLNATNGASIWFDQQEVPRLSLRGSSSPLVAKGVVISASDAGKITSYNLLDGAVVWERLLGLPRGSTELERLVDIDGKLELTGTNLFAVGYNSRLAKIDARNGNVIWSKDYSSNTGVGMGWKNVYLSDSDSHVIAVDQETGSETWRNKDYQYRELTGTRTTGRAIVVGDMEGFVHFLSPQDGTTTARIRASKSAIRVTPVSENNVVYIQADDGTVLAVALVGE